MKPLLLIFFFGLISCQPKEESTMENSAPELTNPTFSKDIAPLVHEHCATCHRPGQSAPFSLLTYRDVQKHADDIATLTKTRYMPPWLPSPSDLHFQGQRTLSLDEIDLFKRWAETGAPEGDPKLTSKAPNWPEGWMMQREPDLVLTLPKPYLLPAEGQDTFRNFVFQTALTEARFVKAVEFRPGNPAVIHHAWMTIEEGDSCHRLDLAHPEQPGFPGMEMGYSAPPDGHALGWTPGKLPNIAPDNMSWELKPGTDLILQLHMVPSGKPETVSPQIGLYFSDQAPTLFPYGLQLHASKIDIPPGVTDYLVERKFTLPVESSLYSLYPHAHYLCTSMKISALLPGGTTRAILDIPSWDFNWQDLYTLEKPLELPKGTTILMRYLYDNSVNNPRNPNNPPIHVRSGDRTSDEMGNLFLQLLPKTPEDHTLLAEASLKNMLAANDNFRDRYTLGTLYQNQQNHPEAIYQYQLALRLNSNHPLIHHNLAGSQAALGDLDKAIASMTRSIELDPEMATSHLNLGNFYVGKKDYLNAHRSYKQATILDPNNLVARKNFEILDRQLFPRK